MCVTQATDKKIEKSVDLQSEIEELLTTKVYGWSTAENFEVPYEIIIEMFIEAVETTCRKHNYDKAHLHYISKELNGHAVIPDSSLVYVESVIRAGIAYDHLKNELLSDGFTPEQAIAILPWVDDLERQFQIDVINSKYDF